LSDNINCSLYVTHLAGGALLGTDSGNAIRFATNGFGSSDEKARIDSSGRLLVGTSSSAAAYGGGVNTLFQVAGGTGNSSAYPGISCFAYSTSDNWGTVSIAKSNSNTAGTQAAVAANHRLGELTFEGSNGTSFKIGASIYAENDQASAWGATDCPSRLVFSTTADGASSPTERVRISQNGVVTVKNGAVAEIGTLTDGATITPDFAANCNFTLTISGSRTLANPTNITAGQTGSIFIIQGSGSNTLSWGSYWDFTGGTAPTLSTASGAVDRVDYVVRTSTSIHTVFTANYS
jgi:hypothetical protein